jgi:hypothetical protein
LPAGGCDEARLAAAIARSLGDGEDVSNSNGDFDQEQLAAAIAMSLGDGEDVGNSNDHSYQPPSPLTHQQFLDQPEPEPEPEPGSDEARVDRIGYPKSYSR